MYVRDADVLKATLVSLLYAAVTDNASNALVLGRVSRNSASLHAPVAETWLE